MSSDPLVKNEQEKRPLTGEEFSEILRRIDALGLTWTEDMPPSMRAKEAQYEEALNSPQLDEIQSKYPRFPYELGNVILHILVGNELSPDVVANEDDLAIKVETTSELVVSSEYKHEFFFQNSLKLPYLDEVDWEVSMKLLENGIDAFPFVHYAAISIDLQNPFNAELVPDRVTFVVDEKRIQRLMSVLKDAQISLEKARQMKTILENHQLKLGAEGNA